MAKIILEYEVDDSWIEYQEFSTQQVADCLASAARKGFDLCYGGVGTKGTDFIKLVSAKPKEEKE